MGSKLYTRIDAWVVNVVSKDDGFPVVDSYWTKFQLAEQRAKKVGGTAYSVDLYEDSYGNVGVIQFDSTYVDVPDREEVLAKLTPEEKYALGLSK